MFEIKGNIIFEPINLTRKHQNQSSWKKVAMVKLNCDLYSYYAWFLKKRFNLKLNKPIRGTHITIINDIVDDNIYNEVKKYFNNKEITIKYDPSDIRTNGTHWWIKAHSTDVENIRLSMGLNPNLYFGLHITIGLATNLNAEHSNYIHKLIKSYGVL